MKYLERIVDAIRNRMSDISFSFSNSKKGGTEELVFTIFIALMAFKGYEIKSTKNVDTDQFLDYYEPYTTYKILPV
jgi:hypothetical protein